MDSPLDLEKLRNLFRGIGTETPSSSEQNSLLQALRKNGSQAGLNQLLNSLLEKRDEEDNEKLKRAIVLIYNSVRERIIQVADKIASGVIQKDIVLELKDKAEEPALPEYEEWNFKLGDAVKISLSREDFKWMQNKTIGWRPDLNEVYGQVGIVTNMFNKYDNAVGIYFPDVYTACCLYAGVLQKVSGGRQESNLHSRWKVGDFVRTVACAELLKMLSRGLGQLPADLGGERGRVVGVTHSCIIVTFDERRTHFLKSSCLIPCEDNAPITPPNMMRCFKAGDEVRLTSNMRKLIKNEKDKGGWSSDMTSIRGQLATVINVLEDGTLNVQTKHFRSWRISPESIVLEGREAHHETDLSILPGDLVRLSIPRNIRAILATADVPMMFLEFLKTSPIVTLVDDNFDYFIKYNQDQNIQVFADVIRKATPEAKESHEKIEERVRDLKKGDKVSLDIGQPNFVRLVTSGLKLSPQVQKALVEPAVIEGFESPYMAVIKYESGFRCRIKKKFLTVPEKFLVGDTMQEVDLEVVEAIRDDICQSVQDIHSREAAPTEDWKVKVISMFHGNPPCVELKIESDVAKYGAIIEWLQEHRTKWKIEDNIGAKQFVVSAHAEDKTDVKTKVSLFFNEEISQFLRNAAMFSPYYIIRKTPTKSESDENGEIKQNQYPVRQKLF